MSESHLAVNRTPVIQSLIRQWPICIEWDCATWISTQRSGNVHTVDAAGAERVRCSCWECGDDIGGCGVVWIQASDSKVPSVGLYSNDEYHREQQRDPTFGRMEGQTVEIYSRFTYAVARDGGCIMMAF
jgi:hypothetical protein